MPQALKPISLIPIGKGKFSQLQLLALWGNKNWLPSMKGKELKIFQNKIGLKGCNWSSLNAPGTEAPVSYLFLGKSLFLIFPIDGDRGGGVAAVR